MPHAPASTVTADPLSDICAASGLRCSSIERWNLRAPWGIRYRGSDNAIVHTVVRGRALLVGLSPEPIEIAEGGTAVMPRDLPHVVASHWPMQEEELYDERPATLSTGTVANLQPGHDADTILMTMPFEVPGRATQDVPETMQAEAPTQVKVLQEPGEELLELLVLVARISLDPTAGTRYIACRVAEAILAKTLQRMAGAEQDTYGLFGLFASVGMRTALKAVQDDPSYAWTVGELSEVAGMSRGQFKAEFAATVGTNVRDYIDLRRLRFAQTRLAAGLANVGEVATSVGFRSKASFHTAVKKLGLMRR